MLDKVPNKNDTMDIASNVCLTTMGAIQFSMTAVYLVIIQKNRLTRDGNNDTKTTKVHVDRNKHCLGKE